MGGAVLSSKRGPNFKPNNYGDIGKILDQITAVTCSQILDQIKNVTWSQVFANTTVANGAKFLDQITAAT